MRSVGAVVLMVMGLLGACAPLKPGRDDGAPVRTDKQSYTLERTPDALALSVIATYTNASDSTVYVARCGTTDPLFQLEKQTEEGWTRAYSPVCPAILVPPIEVRSGEAFTDTASVYAATTPGTHPRFEDGEASGVYRLVYTIYESWSPEDGQPGLGELLPVEARVSNPFRIEP